MAVYNISLVQGENFDLSATLTSSDSSCINLSGYGVRGVAKYSYGSTGVLLDLNPVIVNAASGLIEVHLTPSQTAQLPVTVAVYDIEKYTSGDYIVNKVMNGTFTVNPEVTT